MNGFCHNSSLPACKGNGIHTLASIKAIDNNAIVTCSPVVNSISISRLLAVQKFLLLIQQVICCFSHRRNNNNTLLPRSVSSITHYATFNILSTLPTEVPPNF